MSENLLLPLKNLSSQGEELEFNELELFLGLIAEFNLDCKIKDPLSLKLTLLPLEGGILVKGKLQGQVFLHCNRCAEEYSENLNWTFERFETYPDKLEDDAFEIGDETRIILDAKQNYLLDLQSILGEEFVLAIPMNPLCFKECKGLCPHCGANLNNSSCTCQKETLDPRLQVFRNLKIKSKS
ncbi:MAG: DUF177 domain-containing protein [Desulfovibrionaceae bacterium]|nr:DUF177 domain-containing protein [Desulfovibrionaceae bacterium]